MEVAIGSYCELLGKEMQKQRADKISLTEVRKTYWEDARLIKALSEVLLERWELE